MDNYTHYQIGIEENDTGRDKGLAAHMAIAFGTTARIWLSLQNDYDLWHYRQEHQQELDSIKAYA